MRIGSASRRLVRLAGRVAPLFRNVYVMLPVVFSVWVLFFDSYSVVNIRSAKRRISTLRERKAYYIDRIAQDKRRIEELRTNNANLEKYARETYYMRRANEDLFIVEE